MVNFIESCKTFAECAPEEIKKLKQFDMQKEYPLQTIVEPLKVITECLRKKVHSTIGNLNSLYFEDNKWKLNVNGKSFTSYNVILATGAHPKKLNYPEFQRKEIPLDIALNNCLLKECINKDDIVAVVGRSHSALLVLKYLSEMPVRKIINFYNRPIEYVIEIGNLALNINGLKGTTADWAKNVLEKNPPENLVSLESKPELLKVVLPECTKIIYAIGYEKNDLPELKENPKYEYDQTTGIIAPRLFGIGIAFPEKHVEPCGKVEYRIGLRDFLNYAYRMIPCWMQYRYVKLPSRNHLRKLDTFKDLFEIEVL